MQDSYLFRNKKTDSGVIMKNDDDFVYFYKMILADKKIEVECLNKYVFSICRDYLASYYEPDYVIRTSKEELKDEIIKAIGEEAYNNNLNEKIATEYIEIESKLVLRKIADVLITEDILLVHGAAILIDGKCYIFTADSGTGKTTHILNWLDMIPGTTVINGDKPFINANTKAVYGSPWCGKESMNANMSAPLAGIVMLERGSQNSICGITFQEILPVLIQQTYIPSNHTIRGYQLLNRLSDVPCYKLICNMDRESAVVAYEGLCE